MSEGPVAGKLDIETGRGTAGCYFLFAEGIQTHHLTVTSRHDIYFTEAPTHTVWLVDAAGRERVVHEVYRRSVRRRGVAAFYQSSQPRW